MAESLDAKVVVVHGDVFGTFGERRMPRRPHCFRTKARLPQIARRLPQPILGQVFSLGP